MADEPNQQDLLHPSRHASKPSLDTNASGIADSTISFSAFPSPPSSIPSPIFSTAPSLSGTFGSPVRPLVPRRHQNSTSIGSRGHPEPSSAASISSTVYAPSTVRGPRSPGRALPNPNKAAPSYAWNDGASQISGISVDAAEDRLLPTSFITSLLQENKDLRKAQRRKSSASDALSGISEMTYPPPEDASRYRNFRGQPSRLGAPPSAFSPIPESAQRQSIDSDTLHSAQGHSGANPSKLAPGLASGVANANLRHEPDNHYSSPTNLPTSVSGHEKDARYGYEEEDDDSIMRYKAAFEPPMPPPAYNAATQRRPTLRNNVPEEARQSTHSFRSVAPSFISRISIPHSIRRLLYGRKSNKPLPPVPLIPDISIAVENQYRRADEAAPITELVNRAGQLHGILEKESGSGQESIGGTYYTDTYTVGNSSDTSTYKNGQTLRTDSWQPLRRRDVNDQGTLANLSYGKYSDSYYPPGRTDSRRRCACLPKMARRVWIIIGVAVVLVLVVAIAVPVALKKKKSSAGVPKCELNRAGILCNIDATCKCTASGSQCNGLAQSIVNLIPTVNDKFSTNFTEADIYTSLWLAQGAPVRKDCADQAQLIDTGASLTADTQPERTGWAQAALLWHAIQSQDTVTAARMQTFVRQLPWSDLGTGDGPSDTNASAFTSSFAGYSYNFAAQTVSQPPTTFLKQGQANDVQNARAGPKAQAALDRMYTYALASSTQRETALENYWTTTLSQRAQDLNTFKAMLSASPILLPFNGSSSNIRPLYSSSSLLFPPPLACYPGLSTELMSQVSTFEKSVFNLDSPASASNFDVACFPDRPIYGILDLLRLRLPFMENRAWLPRQAAVLKAEALPRVVVYVNEMLSTTFPGSTPRAKFTSSELDPRTFGTLNLPNHVILKFLSLMPVDTAKLLAEFLVTSSGKPPVPPAPTSALFKALSTVPPLEVAIFGNVGPTDLSGTVSSFMTASGSFFFGTEAGNAMRNWAITTAKGSVAWAENSTAPRIVRDGSLADATLAQAWQAVADRLGASNIGLSNLTTSFETTQKFSSN
ncbi:hypothetical protein DFP72DRAFT_953283 [Ephemerocybe angulata]|uniref:Uncharacterized protein n=1 Tax=Ephemerocybe angulata TaxID=980116 RepID=A0A8H6IKG5_9AGAR|nr:hypothetical protein DFP72DRAFT_953283 [Tulosesus angulatus]